MIIHHMCSRASPSELSSHKDLELIVMDILIRHMPRLSRASASSAKVVQQIRHGASKPSTINACRFSANEDGYTRRNRLGEKSSN